MNRQKNLQRRLIFDAILKVDTERWKNVSIEGMIDIDDHREGVRFNYE